MHVHSSYHPISKEQWNLHQRIDTTEAYTKAADYYPNLVAYFINTNFIEVSDNQALLKYTN